MPHEILGCVILASVRLFYLLNVPEYDPHCLQLIPASSQACPRTHVFPRLQLAGRAQEFQPETKNTR